MRHYREFICLVTFPLCCFTAGDIATYGLDGTTVTYPALNCSVVEDHVTVLCYSTEGAGNGLAWILTVGGQASQSPVTSYAIPNITNIGLATSTGVPLPMSALDTRGLVYAVINGSNFGPVWPRAYVSSVMFGPYNVPNCTMPIPHSQILCPIVPGVGVGLRWMVSLPLSVPCIVRECVPCRSLC